MAKKGVNQQLQELFDVVMTKEHEGIVHTLGEFHFMFHRVNRLARLDIYVKTLCPDNKTRNLLDHEELVEQSGLFVTLFHNANRKYITSIYDGYAKDIGEVMGRITNPEKERFRNALTNYMSRIHLHDKLMDGIANLDDEHEEIALSKI